MGLTQNKNAGVSVALCSELLRVLRMCCPSPLTSIPGRVCAAVLLLPCSVMSDHNRSGRMDDGYSKAPSTADLDNLEVGLIRANELKKHLIEACFLSVPLMSSAPASLISTLC